MGKVKECIEGYRRFRAVSIYDIVLKKFLLGTVARWTKPGCRMNLVIILAGPQGIGKDQFIRKLCPPSLYGEITTADNIIDHEQTVRASGLVNLNGIDGILRAKKLNLKSLERLISPTHDTWGPRHCTFIATCVDATFLRDYTGSLNYAVIPVPDDAVIDIEELEAEKDSLWLSLYIEYLEKVKAKEDYIWWLSPEEKEQLTLSNLLYLKGGFRKRGNKGAIG